MSKYKSLDANIRQGDKVKYGRYPQGKDGTVKPITWRVLDVQGDKALLVSEYGLDVRRYHGRSGDVTWEMCSLRKWLNAKFLDTALTPDEQEQIVMTRMDNPDNAEYGTLGGNDTEDKVFLLNINEVYLYFVDDKASRVEPTAYARSHGADTSRNGTGWWWLRSPGGLSFNAALVNTIGGVLTHGSNVNSAGAVVRPALWVNLKS